MEEGIVKFKYLGRVHIPPAKFGEHRQLAGYIKEKMKEELDIVYNLELHAYLPVFHPRPNLGGPVPYDIFEKIG